MQLSKLRFSTRLSICLFSGTKSCALDGVSILPYSQNMKSIMFIIRHYSLSKLKCLLIAAILLFTLIVISLFADLILYIISTREPRSFLDRIRKLNCIPYTVIDPRPFFERDAPQMNLPRRVSRQSEKDIIRELDSLRLLVLATARNVETDIDEFRRSIEAIIDLFHPSSRILVCESDSSDKTLEKLSAWPRAQLYTYGNLFTIYPERPERIAFCRNKLLNVSREIPADYLLMTDVDVFTASIPSFLSNFRYNRDEWSVMTASSGVYYDIWAVRTLSDSVLNYDVWHRIWQIDRETNYCFPSLVNQYVDIQQRPIPVEHGLIEVRSAFNGGGLYKANATDGCHYSGANLTCEHVPFHLCIREKNHGRIFINPEFLIN